MPASEPKVQRYYSRVLSLARSMQPLFDTVQRRLVHYFGVERRISYASWLQVVDVLRDLPAFIRFSYTRTLLGAWTTSARMEQAVKPCVCGCGGSKDHMSHYLSDCILLNLVSHWFPRFVPSFEPLHFLGIAPPCRHQIISVAFACRLYHMCSKNPGLRMRELAKSLFNSNPSWARLARLP
eukprot:304772-Karenia_brevis.AAC.1